MNKREVCKFISNYFFIFACFICLPLFIAIYHHTFVPRHLHPQPHSTFAFSVTLLFCLGLGFIFRYFGKGADGRKFFRREGFLSLSLIWFLSGIIGGMPFLLSGTLTNPIEAYFEAMSAITTTGSSVMYPKNIDLNTLENKPIHITASKKLNIKYTFYGNINPIIDNESKMVLYAGTDAVSRAILFWKSLLQWLGGMGIVILFIAILPAYGLGGNKLLVQAELPGPSSKDLAPRARDIAVLLWKVYCMITLTGIGLLMLTDPEISLWDAIYIISAFVSTSGFIPYRQSLYIFNNPAAQWLCMLFMFIGSVNFALIFQVIKGKLYRLFDAEFLLYLLTLLIGSSCIILSLVGTEEIFLVGVAEKLNFVKAFRIGLFQYLSSQSTTGYILLDYDQWPHFAQAVLITSMYIGAMSCSSGGGIKIMRYYILFKTAFYRTESIFKPEEVRSFKISKQPINPIIKETTLSFFFIAITCALVSTLIYIADGLDFQTAFSVASSMINNVGVAYGPAGGPTQTFTFLPNFSKLISTFWMVLGRLEFYMVLILLTKTFWREA